MIRDRAHAETVMRDLIERLAEEGVIEEPDGDIEFDWGDEDEEFYGHPKLEPVYNQLFDLDKQQDNLFD